eukprot:g20181.t1
MVQWPGSRILHRHELDAFLAQAVSSKLYEPDQLQELKIDKLDARGIQLAALFMSGVDTALFANDACGQPIPWDHCCPWIYFDGKLLHSKFVQATREKAPLIDLCDGQVCVCLSVCLRSAVANVAAHAFSASSSPMGRSYVNVSRCSYTSQPVRALWRLTFSAPQAAMVCVLQVTGLEDV